MKQYYARYSKDDGLWHENVSATSRYEYIFSAENDKQARQIALAYGLSKGIKTAIHGIQRSIDYYLIDLKQINLKQRKVKFDPTQKISDNDLEEILKGADVKEFKF